MRTKLNCVKFILLCEKCYVNIVGRGIIIWFDPKKLQQKVLYSTAQHRCPLTRHSELARALIVNI